MAVALVQGISNLSSTATATATATLPAAATAGNVLVAFTHVASRNAGGAPAGWTQPAGGNANVNGRSTTIAYKVAAGGETGFSTAVTSGTWEVHLVEYSGVDTTTPVQVAAASTGGVTTTAVTTTAGSNVHVVCSGAAATGPSATAWSGPTIGGAAATFVTVAPSTRLQSGTTAYGATYHLGVGSAPTSISGTVTGVGSNIASGIVVLNVAAATGPPAYTGAAALSATGSLTSPQGADVVGVLGAPALSATGSLVSPQGADVVGVLGAPALAATGSLAAGVAAPPVGQLVDDFTTQDTAKWVWSADTFVSGGQLVVNCMTTYPNIYSARSYALAGSAFSAQIVSTPPTGDGTTETFLFMGDTAGNRVQISMSGGQLNLVRYSNGAWFDGPSIAYDPTAMAYWRIREAGGTLYWETAPDGVTWTVRRSVTGWAEFDVTSAVAFLSCGYYGTNAAPGFAVFDNVNTAAAPAYSGGVALAAVGSLAGAGAARPVGAAALTSTGSLGIVGGARAVGAVTLAATGGLTPAGAPSPAGGAQLSAAGALTVPARAPAAAGAVALASAGSLALAGAPAVARPVQLTATGSLTGTGAPAAPGTAPLAAAGTLTTAGIPRPVATAPLSGVGVLVLAAVPAPRGGASLAGAGALTLAGTTGNPKASTLTDAFTTADAVKWNGIDGTNVLVTGGRLQVNATPSYFSAYSVRAYDLTGSQVSVEVPQVPNLGNGSTSAYLTAYDMVTGNSADLLWQGGTLYTSYTAGGVTSQTEIMFSPTAHRFWRIREAAGTLYWEATATGASWSQLRAVPTPWTMTAVTIFLKSGYWGTEPAPGFALFDNVNLPPTPATPGAARTFYVDPAGSDTADGLTAGTAWATLAKVNTAPLYPGDSVLLLRGATFPGGVTISDSGASGAPITLGAYGTGALPIVDGGGASGVAGTARTGELSGSWVVADGVEFRGSSDHGVLVFGTDCTVQGCGVRWGSYGVTQLGPAARAKILNNTMIDVNVGVIRPGTNDDAGASGVLLEGDAAEVAHNTVSGCVFTSPDYGLDGQSIEIYGATNATIHHNRSIDSVTFTELGNPSSSGNTFYDNVITSALAVGSGFTVHGTYYDDGTTPDPFGPVTGTRAWHNTVVLTGGDAAASGVWVSPGGEIDWRNNVVVVAGSAKAASIGATSRTVTEAGNVWWNTGGAAATVVALPAAMAASSVKTDPLFVSSTDYRLRPGSPAIDRGVVITGAAITTDYAGNARTSGAAPDAGAYEGAVSGFSGAPALSGAGSLITVGAPRGAGAVPLSGTAGLAAPASPAVKGTGGFAAGGTLGVSTAPAVKAAPALAGVGTLVAAAAAAAARGPAALAGVGTLVAAGAAWPKVATLTDDFTTQNTAKWSGWGTNVAIDAGRLRIDTTTAYSNAYSVASYDLRGSAVSVEVVQLPARGNGTTAAYLTVGDAAGNRVDITWGNGALNAQYTVGGVNNSGALVTYNPNLHRIWRIREAGGTLYWEASPNGSSWVNLRPPVATPAALGAVNVILQSGYYGAETAPGSAIFDNVDATYSDPARGPLTFYVDPAGSDGNDGLSSGAAWATLGKVIGTPLHAGDQVLLRRGGTWTGNLPLVGAGTSALPITVGAYGTGAQPVISGGGSSGVAGTYRPCEVYGSFFVLDGVEFRGASDIDVYLLGPDCTVQNCTVRWGSFGVEQDAPGPRAKILNNTIIDVNVGIIGPGTDDDNGAMAILLGGDGAEVASNTISGSVFTSPDYGLDGSGVEIYGATNATIHHNRISDCAGGVEMGNAATSNCTFHTNVITSSIGGGISVHGGLYSAGVADPYGPVLGTKLHHNTIMLTSGVGDGIWVGMGGEVDLRNNIVVVTGSVHSVNIETTTRTVTEGGNVLWNTSLGAAGGNNFQGASSPNASSAVADPLFVSGTDLRLRAGSPALDRGVDLGYATDYTGNPRVSGPAPDAGAYEGAVVVAFTGSAATGGTGTLTGAGAPTVARAPALAGSGVLALTVRPAFTRSTNLTGSGSLVVGRVGPVTAARGVNESGAEYNVSPDGVWGTFPGTYGSQWFYDAPASIAYLASRGINSTRLPIAWERLQPVRGAALDTAEQGRITSYLDTCHANGIRVIIVPASFCRYREGAYPTPGITVRLLGVDLTAADFTDLWTRMVAAFGAHPAVLGWELQNEPWGLPSTNLASTFGATFDATLSGWTTQNCTLTRTTTAPRTGAGALQMTVTQTTSGGTNAQVWFATGGATSLTFSVWVRSPAATSPAQLVIDWYDSAMTYLTSTGHGWVNNVSPAWQQVAATVTPPAGAWRGVLSLDAYGATAGDVFIWDDLTSNALAVQTGAQLWEATAQTLVTAIRATGDGHMIYVPGNEWQAPTKWRAQHPSPFVTDPAGRITYSAHHYYDKDQNATFAYSYAQENADAISEGYGSITGRALSWLAQFTDWCQEFGVKGALTETGWPHNADAAAWNAVADALYNRLDQLGMDVWVWMVGESYGATNQLSPYDTAGTGSTLSAANAQASIVEAHLGSGPPGGAVALSATGSLAVPAAVPGVARPAALNGTGTLALAALPAASGAAGLTAQSTLTISPAKPTAAGAVSLAATGSLAVPARAPGVVAGLPLSGVGQLTLAAVPAAGGTAGTTAAGLLLVSAAGAGAGAVALNAVGAFTAAALVAASGTGGLTGQATLTISSAGLTAAGAVALSATGALTPTRVISTGGVATLSAVGALVVVGSGGAGFVILTATGALGLGGAALTVSAAAALTGVGALATGTTPAAGGSAALAGIGALSLAGVPAPAGVVVLAAAGSLLAAGAPRPVGAVTLAATGVLFGGRIVPVTFTGVGQLTLGGVPSPAQLAAFTATGLLVLAALPPSLLAGVALTATGTLTPLGTRVTVAGGAVTLTAFAALGMAAIPVILGLGAFTGTGALTLAAIALGQVVHRPSMGRTTRGALGITARPDAGRTNHT